METSRGITLYKSRHSVREIIDRLETLVQAHGATVYARIDQQAELRKAGLEIPPLEFILFGNPKAGGQVILENPMAALDLPLKIIAWEDHKRNVFIAYNDEAYITERYGLTQIANSPLNLDTLVTAALNS
ncbi:DUF302 domain-containing protein [Mucilaginibacter gotjawali]|uniref:Uncharacterized protein (DUF302 family) n=2 Tax=Mucilaginibacter gotjawali TaxID=1550579 RepID=A0A839SLQ7_9SPHI|nr:DUF302 domain-containing protein [Mucilaginibacter gotjawali]MBB3058816.1 uncharacterized protein (DUF302 family) [Mucilaginibacter gotjawali]BAU52215.1 hypothetical protein MgSA37_00365 [Mucilaginibacter gotjawali]